MRGCNIWQGSKAEPPQWLLSFRIFSQGWGIGNLFFAIKGVCSLPHSWVSMHCYTSANNQEHPSWNNFFFFPFGLWTVSEWPNSVCVTSLLLIKTQERILQLSQAQHWFLLATVPKQSTNIALGIFLLFCLVRVFFIIIPLVRKCFKEIGTKCQLLWVKLNKLHVCVCKGRQRHALLLTREINCMCKFRKCRKSWTQTSRRGERWSLQWKERRQWRKCCHHLPAALWPSDWSPGQGWQDAKKPKAIAKFLLTDLDISSQFTCFNIQILQTNCSQQQSSSQLNALLLGPSKGAWDQSSIFTSINLKATQEGSEPPAQPLMWFLFDLCRNYATWREIYLLVSKKKTKMVQATNLQLPPTRWIMAV